MIFKHSSDKSRDGSALAVAVTFASIVACSSPQAAEIAKSTHASSAVVAAASRSLSPTDEQRHITEYVTSSGSVIQPLAPALTDTVNRAFQDLFMSVLHQKPAFKCFKAGCIQETIVANWSTIDLLDEKMLSPGSSLLGLPGAVHRGAPVPLANGGLSVTWAILVTETEYPLLASTLKRQSAAAKYTRP